MAQRIQRGTLLAGIGAWSGGVPGVAAVDAPFARLAAVAGRDWCS